jgi:hypothetical protein
MRRILRKISSGEGDAASLGDLSTLADPSIVDSIVRPLSSPFPFFELLLMSCGVCSELSLRRRLRSKSCQSVELVEKGIIGIFNCMCDISKS